MNKKMIIFAVSFMAITINAFCQSTDTTNITGKTIISQTSGIELVGITGGSFTMGTDGDIAERDCLAHEVSVSSFYMATTEVTQNQWKSVMGKLPAKLAPASGDTEKNPVNKVSWYAALVFCNLLSQRDGKTPCYSKNGVTDANKWGAIPAFDDEDWNNIKCDWNANGYRLPTEAEWEYAARSGNNVADKYVWSGTDRKSAVSNYAWSNNNSGDTSHEIATKKPNTNGLFDMSGNVLEWCWDWYSESYDTDVKNDPRGASSGTGKVFRGGAWFSMDFDCSVSFRYSKEPSEFNSGTGLRLVCGK